MSWHSHRVDMRVCGRLGIAAIAAVCALPVLAQTQTAIPGVLAGGVELEVVREDFVFTEGPVGTAEGGLYFSDIQINNRAGRTYYLDPAGKFTIVREPTNGANGLALTKDGELLFVETGTKSITRRDREGRITTATDGYAGGPMVGPNDLIADAKGGIYITDPGPRPVVPGRPNFVSYLPPGAKKAIVVDDKVPRPNGIALTRNGRTLIVDDTTGNTVFAYDVQDDGTLRNRRPFVQLLDIPAGQESGADGMAIDREDRVYITTNVGIQVFDAAGKYLGRIMTARKSANAAFAGPDKRTLYITAREALYRIKLQAQGPDRLGK
jgi:gluconolactonase